MRRVSSLSLCLLVPAVCLAADNAAKHQFTCATCHRDEGQFQPKTPMGNAIQLPADQATLKANPKLTFAANGYSYSIERKGDASIYTVSDGTNSLSLPIRYAFGVHMQTFVLEHENHFFESLVSYYPSIRGLAITMGDGRIQPHNLVEAMGRPTAMQETLRCFGCHSTGAVSGGELHLENMRPGLDCNVCHTEAAAHLQGFIDGKPGPVPRKLGKMSAEETSNFCGNCHRSWDSVVRMRVWGELNVRFQPYRLANSKCFLGDDKRIACTSCHNPHHDLVRDEASYDSKCLACHTSGLHTQTRPAAQAAASVPKTCPVATRDCVSCHMPKVELPGSHAKFTDHDIRVVRAGEPYPN